MVILLVVWLTLWNSSVSPIKIETVINSESETMFDATLELSKICRLLCWMVCQVCLLSATVMASYVMKVTVQPVKEFVKFVD